MHCFWSKNLTCICESAGYIIFRLVNTVNKQNRVIFTKLIFHYGERKAVQLPVNWSFKMFKMHFSSKIISVSPSGISNRLNYCMFYAIQISSLLWDVSSDIWRRFQRTSNRGGGRQKPYPNRAKPFTGISSRLSEVPFKNPLRKPAQPFFSPCHHKWDDWLQPFYDVYVISSSLCFECQVSYNSKK